MEVSCKHPQIPYFNMMPIMLSHLYSVPVRAMTHCAIQTVWWGLLWGFGLAWGLSWWQFWLVWGLLLNIFYLCIQYKIGVKSIALLHYSTTKKQFNMNY